MGVGLGKRLGVSTDFDFGWDFWRQNVYGGWATLTVVFIILIYHFIITNNKFRSSSKPPSPSLSNPQQSLRISKEEEIVSDADLKFLIKNLDEDENNNEKWETVIHKTNTLLSYNARCCRPKDAPLKYLSLTVFENCSPHILRDFYMDNQYRKQWDNTLLHHHQLHLLTTFGIEIGRTIKKFPLFTPREYILAWRLWEGNHNTFYCFIKDCQHPSAPPTTHNNNYVRVAFFKSGWRIRKVPGRNACEIKMFHQEDAGFNMQMAKLAFAKGIWSYVCKMDNALRKYSPITPPQTTPPLTAVTLIQKVPPGLETTNSITSSATPAASAVPGLLSGEAKEKKFSKRLLANGLILLGGVICLSRGHSSLGAKVAMAYILTKLGKRGASSSQSVQSLGT